MAAGGYDTFFLGENFCDWSGRASYPRKRLRTRYRLTGGPGVTRYSPLRDMRFRLYEPRRNLSRRPEAEFHFFSGASVARSPRGRATLISGGAGVAQGEGHKIEGPLSDLEAGAHFAQRFFSPPL